MPNFHVVYKYILSKFNAYSMNACTHSQTCTHMHKRACARAHTHTHTPVAYQGCETEEKVFEKRKVFKEDLKELTGVEWQIETGSWFQITGAW